MNVRCAIRAQPHYRLTDFRRFAQTLEWFRQSAAPVDQALSDPLWGRTFDLAYEAEVAALARAR